MVRTMCSWSVLILCCFGLLAASTVAAQASPQGVVVFKSQNSLPADAVEIVEAAGGSVVRSLPAIGTVVVEADDPSTFATLSSHSAVHEAGLAVSTAAGAQDGEVFPQTASGTSGLQMELARTSVGGLSSALTTNPENAVFLGFQWNLHQIRSPDVWAEGNLGDPNVVVAVVDSGLDYTHQELVGKVDLSRSVSFLPSDDAIVAANFPGAHPIADLHGLGTHLAGLISCNAIGTACIAPNVTLFGVKVADQDHTVDTAALIAGIVYSADQGADIILSSFPVLLDAKNRDQRATLLGIHRAVKHAANSGAAVFAAVGPAGHDADKDKSEGVFAAQAPLAFGIAAVNRFDEPSDISGRGQIAVDFSAPGGRFIDRTSSLEDSVLGPCSSFSLRIPTCQRPNPGDPFRYVFFIGGIPAMAHGAGIAALMDSRVGGAMGVHDLFRLLPRAAIDIGPPGTDAFNGKGRLDALLANQATLSGVQ